MGQLAVARISTEWHYKSRLIDPKTLGKEAGKLAKLNWHVHDDSANQS